MDLANLFTGSAALLGALLGGLIARGTARRASRIDRTDEYHRECRSAAVALICAARIAVDAAESYDSSIGWHNGVIGKLPDSDLRFEAWKEAYAKLKECAEDFELLVDQRALWSASFDLRVRSGMLHDQLYLLKHADSNGEKKESITAIQTNAFYCKFFLVNRVIPDLRAAVKKHIPPTIVGEGRRRERSLRPLKALWRWLVQQHRKNLPPPPKQSRPAE